MAQTEKRLTKQLKAVENDIEGIDVQIASDGPETSDLLLTYRETAISLRAVDFPQPDGPSRETNSPLFTSRSNGPSAITPLS